MNIQLTCIREVVYKKVHHYALAYLLLKQKEFKITDILILLYEFLIHSHSTAYFTMQAWNCFCYSPILHLEKI
jgi:hypothetical protein